MDLARLTGDPRVTIRRSGELAHDGTAVVYWMQRAQRLSLDDLQWTPRPFDGVNAYAQITRMQVILTELLARRWSRERIGVYSMHPGWADTPSVQSSIPRFWRLMRSRLRTAEQGADTLVWLVVAPPAAMPAGRLWLDRAPRRCKRARQQIGSQYEHCIGEKT